MNFFNKMESFDIKNYIQTYNLGNIEVLRRKETGWITILNEILVQKIKNFGALKAIEISSDKKTIFLGTLYGTVILFDVETLEYSVIEESGLGGVVYLKGEGKYIVAAWKMGKLAIIDNETKKIWKIANFEDTEFFFFNLISVNNSCIHAVFSDKNSAKNFYFEMTFGYFSDSQKIQKINCLISERILQVEKYCEDKIICLTTTAIYLLKLEEKSADEYGKVLAILDLKN